MKAAFGGSLAVVCVVLALSCDYDDLDDIPPGFADGVDNQLTFESPGSYTGVADTAARSDHTHDMSILDTKQDKIVRATASRSLSGYWVCASRFGGAGPRRDEISRLGSSLYTGST